METENPILRTLENLKQFLIENPISSQLCTSDDHRNGFRTGTFQVTAIYSFRE